MTTSSKTNMQNNKKIEKMTLKKLKSRFNQLRANDPFERGFVRIKETNYDCGTSYSNGLLTFYGNFPERESILDLIK